jgi:DNA-binding MarR family transcriptional regulator
MDENRSPGERAWATLVGVLFTHRLRWVAAGQAEGLTPPQAMALMRVRAERPPSLGELARHIRCDASYATNLADRLEERGFVERRISDTDRRVKELVPTPAGIAAQQRLVAAFTDPPPGLEELSDEDQATLLRIAAFLAARAEPEAAETIGLKLRPDD